MNERAFLKLIALAASFFLLAACATTPKIDWESRIGNYTYDNAVLELGPPDKTEKLTDGTRVADWLTARGRGGVVTFGGGYYRRFGPSFHTIDPGPDYFLRLTFDPNGKLLSWRKYAR